VDPLLLLRKVHGPRIVVLAGRSWSVTHVDWCRRRCYVEPAEALARMGCTGQPATVSYELCRAQRDVLLGADPDVLLSRRAHKALDPCVCSGRRLRGATAPSYAGTATRGW
jgi:ATP-dependent helicase Lhr and Lhr-like helicase